MTPQTLFQHIQRKRSFLCVGLDTDMSRIPSHLLSEKDPIFAFNREIVQATAEYAVAYKPNLAFYEAMGAKGWESLEKTLEIIPDDIMVIADAKRGDIGNTSRLYAKAFFENLDVEALTVAPYMGEDSVGPFLEFENKWVFLLALTSNPSAADFQYEKNGNQYLYEKVLLMASLWAEKYPGNLGFVVGATRPEALAGIRKLVPNAFFLVPGVGAQGGDLRAVCENGRNEQGGLLINSSRGIIYAGDGPDFAQKAAEVAASMQQQMAEFI
ncbi:MAG: orotidine-5'-phosphate decarboxylase [Bacteroidota bacterium]